MRKLSLSSTFVLSFATTLALLAGCAVQDTTTEPTSNETSDSVSVLGGGGGGLSCDDFDSYCSADRPCGDGFVCEFDASHCGSNFFGTYPNCGVTATCYPACQPAIAP